MRHLRTVSWRASTVQKVLWAAMVVAITTGMPSRAATQEHDFIELVLELRIEDGPSSDVVGLIDETILIPLVGFLGLAEIGVQDTEVGHSLTGIHPVGGQFTFDTDSGVAVAGERRVSIEPGQVLWRGDVLYVATGLLDEVFSVRTQSNLAELTLTISGSQDLPVVLRLERERAVVAAVPPAEQEFVELLIEMRIDGGPSGDVVALADGVGVLVPVNTFLELAEIAAPEIEVGRRLSGLHPADVQFVFDTESGFVSVAARQIQLLRGYAVWRDEVLYVETGILESVFSVRMELDFGALALNVLEGQGLPVVQRLEQERAVLAMLPPEQELVELLIEVRIEGGPSGNVIALANGVGLLVPLDRLMELAEIGVPEVEVDHRLSGTLYPAGEQFVFDTDSSLATIANRRIVLEPGYGVWQQEMLHVETGVLESVFSVRMRLNLAELTLDVWETQNFPVVQRLDRERKRERLLVRPARPEANLYSVRRRPVDGAVFDWALTSATTNPSQFTGVDLGLGAQVLGGSALLLHEERRSSGSSSRRTTGSWTRAWHTTPWLRQIRLGEAVGTGPRVQVVQGVVVTNSPFVRPVAFGLAPLDGMFGPGWEVELYKGSQFLGFARADSDGRYSLDVPIRYGENPLDIVAFGPRGEVLRRRRTFEVDAARFPAKQFEYGVSVGGCAFAPCDAQANIDLRYGFNEQITGRGGVYHFWRDSLANAWHPYATVVYQPMRALALFAEAVGNALVASRVDYAPSQDFNAGIGHTIFVGDVADPLIGSPSESHITQASVFYRPALWDYRTFGRMFVQRSAGDGRVRTLARATIAARFGGARLEVGAAYDRLSLQPRFSNTRTILDARYYHTYSGSLAWLRRTLLFAELAAEPDSGLVLARSGFSRTLGGRFQLDMAVGWTENRGATFDLGLTATLHAVRAVSTTQFSNEGTEGFLVAEGSVLWDGSGRRLELSDGRSLGRAGIVGEVFLDVDGDGRAGPDEPRVPDVYVRVGPIASVTDHTGRFVVWDLVPFEAVVVEIDAQSVRNPLWLPVLDRFTFRPDPNMFSVIPVPLVQVGEVSGRVVVGPREAGARFLEVELRNLDTDDSYTVTTFSDGTFYLLGLRPGRYEATVSQELLDELGLAVELATFTVGTAVEQAFVEDVTVRLVER